MPTELPVPRRPKEEPALVHVTCPNCHSPKAVIAAAHFDLHLCFCPACEHVWEVESATD